MFKCYFAPFYFNFLFNSIFSRTVLNATTQAFHLHFICYSVPFVKNGRINSDIVRRTGFGEMNGSGRIVYRCVFEQRKINCFRNCMQYWTMHFARSSSDEMTIYLCSKIFRSSYFSQSTDEIFLIRVMDEREENRNTSFLSSFQSTRVRLCATCTLSFVLI